MSRLGLGSGGRALLAGTAQELGHLASPSSRHCVRAQISSPVAVNLAQKHSHLHTSEHVWVVSLLCLDQGVLTALLVEAA